MKGDNDGAILTVFKERTFHEVHLLWNHSNNLQNNFEEIANYVKKEILKRKLCTNVSLHKFDCSNVTDHNEIYPKLLSFCRALPQAKNKKYTAAIASGTPAMQVCWILLAESGDFPLSLIRSNEPKFGKPFVTDVTLGTQLPRIIRLQEENEQLKQQTLDLLPVLNIDLKNGIILVGEISIPLGPIEFAYYVYFAERQKRGKDTLRVSEFEMPKEFVESVNEIYSSVFPQLDINLKSKITVETFRGNVSKANKKIAEAIANKTIAEFYKIAIEGKRHARSYGLKLPEEKIYIQR